MTLGGIFMNENVVGRAQFTRTRSGVFMNLRYYVRERRRKITRRKTIL